MVYRDTEVKECCTDSEVEEWYTDTEVENVSFVMLFRYVLTYE